MLEFLKAAPCFPQSDLYKNILIDFVLFLWTYFIVKQPYILFY